MSIRYLPLSGLLPPCFKGHTEGKILENDIETLHQNRLIAYTAWKRGKELKMPRMSRKRRLEPAFFLNERNRITYNELCRKCRHPCKQSFRAIVIECPKYLSKRSRQRDETEDGENEAGAGNGRIP